MIFKLARLQFNKMPEKVRFELKPRVDVFAASDTHVISHFNRNGIMCLETLELN